MKQKMNLQLKQKHTQQLNMTQQLHQAIALLQKNQEELTEYIVEKSNENPLIEVVRTLAPSGEGVNYGTAPKIEDQFANLATSQNYASLFEYLIDQVHLNYRATPIREMILFLVEYIDENGYLTIDLKEAAKKAEVSDILALDALTLLQQLDPAGIGARDLRECLMLQTERDPEAPQLAYIILEEHFEELANRKWQVIADAYNISFEEIQQVMDYIQLLSPAPGSHFGAENENYVIPEIEVIKNKGQLEIHYLTNGLPKLKYQANYFEEMAATKDPEVLSYLKDKKAQYEWLVKTLQQRKNTIHEVAKEIVNQQQAFFLQEDHPLKPLTLKEVAKKVKIHESTVSRAVNGKYLKTAFGIFELRTFFVSAISGQDTSTQEVKKELIEIIKDEMKQKPYSDQKISELMEEKGIKISRRTIAKYREELGIPTSSQRKRYE